MRRAAVDYKRTGLVEALNRCGLVAVRDHRGNVSAYDADNNRVYHGAPHEIWEQLEATGRIYHREEASL